jgi:threonine dehydratase
MANNASEQQICPPTLVDIKEAAAAVGLAAVLSHTIDIRDKVIGVITTGGNVDAADICAAPNARAE